MNREKRNKSRETQGFTLAELLIVIAIIAVLAAVAIPILSAHLERVRAVTCMADRRALKAELSVALIEDPTAAEVSRGSHGLSAEQKAKYVCPDKGNITYSIDAAQDKVEVFCSKHTARWDRATMTEIEAVFEDIYSHVSQVVDSTAVGQSTDYRAQAEKKFSDAGIDLDALGAKSWRISSQANYKAFQWSTEDISAASPGDKVLVMQYKPGYGYTVWESRVKLSDSGAYNIIDDSGRTQITQSTDDKSDFDAIKAVYNAAALQRGIDPIS